MKKGLILLMTVGYFTAPLSATEAPEVTARHANLFGTYEFVRQLTDSYPENACKDVFRKSVFNKPEYQVMLATLDTLALSYSYGFDEFPSGQKLPLMSGSLIRRNLATSVTMDEFRNKTFGIVPYDQLIAFAEIIEAFVPVYGELVYLPNKEAFEKQVVTLNTYIRENHFDELFAAGLDFYGVEWDASMSFDILVYPSMEKNSFTGEAFLNVGVSQIPVGLHSFDVVMTVLMHEMYHILYDCQSVQMKRDLHDWFQATDSPNSQYALLLLNEALATALGNGYVYEALNGELEKGEWYNLKYIDQMAQKMYPLVKSYLQAGKQMDAQFVAEYVRLYDANFSPWIAELDNLLTYRYVLAQKSEDLRYINRHYRATSSGSGYPIDQLSLERMRQTPETKVLIVSEDHAETLRLIQQSFEELKKWKYKANREFVAVFDMSDRTKLIIINRFDSSVEELFNTFFPERLLMERDSKRKAGVGESD